MAVHEPSRFFPSRSGPSDSLACGLCHRDVHLLWRRQSNRTAQSGSSNPSLPGHSPPERQNPRPAAIDASFARPGDSKWSCWRDHPRYASGPTSRSASLSPRPLAAHASCQRTVRTSAGLLVAPTSRIALDTNGIVMILVNSSRSIPQNRLVGKP